MFGRLIRYQRSMAAKSSAEIHMRPLILAAEREAQMVSAFARLAVITIAMTIFIFTGGIDLPVAPVVLTYLVSYALVSVVSALFFSRGFLIRG
jgi:ribose/xylose/arabinose/galactoside ABC-type transport system permease subunit